MTSKRVFYGAKCMFSYKEYAQNNDIEEARESGLVRDWVIDFSDKFISTVDLDTIVSLFKVPTKHIEKIKQGNYEITSEMYEVNKDDCSITVTMMLRIK